MLNYSDKRKVVEVKDGTKSWSNKKDANKAKDILIAAVATKKPIELAIVKPIIRPVKLVANNNGIITNKDV